MIRKTISSIAFVACLQFGAIALAEPTEDGANLAQVLAAIQEGVTEAQANNLEGFPPLKSVSVTLNATASKTRGGGVSFLIFSLSSKHSAEACSTLMLQLTPPATKTASGPAAVSESLKSLLAQAINTAKQGLMPAKDNPLHLNLSEVKIEVRFTVKSDNGGGVKTGDLLPIGLEGTAGATKSMAHTVELVFAGK